MKRPTSTTVLTVFGTRPEAIKMAPVVHELRAASNINSVVCLSGQHKEMLYPVLDFFDVEAQFDLEVMGKASDLPGVYTEVMSGLNQVLKKVQPNLVLVHGDTATTAAASLCCFLNKIPVGHVEAGLRTGNLSFPWPEELNRRVAGLVSNLHFAPTDRAKNNLLLEKIPSSQIDVTGNTVIDALFFALKKLELDPNFAQSFFKKYQQIDFKKNIVLVTGHRRENFGPGIANMCEALKTVAANPSTQVVYPVHLNPNIKGPVYEILGNNPNIFLLEPMDYNEFIFMMKNSYLIITDSGGIQEEAPSIGKPVLVTRNETERQEAVDAGTVTLVGTDRDKITQCALNLLNNEEAYLEFNKAHSPYGDGTASKRIVSRIQSEFSI